MEERASGESQTLTGNRIRSTYPFLRWQVVIGTMILNLPNAIPSYYGNLSTYTDSYFHCLVGGGAGKNQTAWMLPLYLCFSVVGFITVDFVVRKCGLFASQIIALILFDVSIFFTYITIQHSIFLTMFSLMISGGYFAGMLFVINLIYSVKVVPHQSGIASAVSSSGCGLGGLFINFLITSYVNPSNLVPDIRGTNQAYFSQSRILDNVPQSFVFLGAYNFVLHILGLLVMHIPLRFINSNEQTSNDFKIAEKERNVQTLNSLDTVSLEEGTDYDVHRQAHKADRISSSDIPLHETLNSDTGSEPERHSVNVPDVQDIFRPLELLQTRSFYIAWISVCALSAGLILSQSYYKHFGQLWIKDDDFLTTSGSISSVTAVAYRVAVGALIDRVGLKLSMALLLSINSITMSFWYLTARGNRTLYFMWVQVICANTGSLYVLTPMISLKLYGKTYYGTNYGLLMTGCLITSLVEPLLIPAVLENAGWFELMALESAVSLLTLMLTLFIDVPML